MSRVLFFTWSGGGNQTPAIGLAQQLRRAGHDVLVAGYPDQVTRFEGFGLEFVPLPGGPGEADDPFNPADLMRWLVRNVWACPHHVAGAVSIMDRHQPDLIIVDCLMGGVLAAVERAASPSAALVHSTPGALAPPDGPLDGLVVGALNRIRADLDLAPLHSFWEAWQQHAVLNASIPELDPIGSASFGPATWIGPVFEDVTPPDEGPGAHGDDPLVLVSFSSTPAWDQTSRIQRTIDGLARLDVRVIVTAGATDPELLHLPTVSTEVVSYAPHGAILPRASAVVTHAGHGTLSAALAHGLPIVAIPNHAADQPALADRIAHLGAGIHLDDDAANPETIGAAVRAVLDEPGYGARARALGERVQSYRGRPLAAVTRLLDDAVVGSR